MSKCRMCIVSQLVRHGPVVRLCYHGANMLRPNEPSPSPSLGPDSSPDMVIGTRMADMRPAVRKYAENIQAQRVQIIADLGFPSLAALQSAFTANPRALIAHGDAIAHLLDLTHVIEAILTNPKEYKLPVEEEFLEKETELQELLGKDFFLGFDAIEKTFTLNDGTKALEISPEERQEAMEGLLTKLAEPDVIEFLHKLESDKTEAAKWMLVYRTRAQINDTQPVSILGLRDVLDTDSRKGSKPTKLVYKFEGAQWYANDKAVNEPDTWATRPVQSGWTFVTKTVVDGTTSKKHPDQTPVLKKKAKALGFTEGKYRRRTPQEVLYDILVVYKANNIRLLEQKYDWTEQRTSSGGLVRVGSFDADGARVCGFAPGDASDWRGACLSR